MSYPVPAPGHAIVIVNVHGRLYATDVIAEELTWSRRDRYAHPFDAVPFSQYDDLVLRGVIMRAAIYDETTGQTRPDPDHAGLPPARPELEQ